MPRRLSVCILLAATLAVWGPAVAGPPPQRAAELARLVRHDCGSCHGLRLRGGLGPALTPRALAGKPVELLVATVLEGRAGTPMPPWKPFLTEEEARWIVEGLRRGDFLER